MHRAAPHNKELSGPKSQLSLRSRNSLLNNGQVAPLVRRLKSGWGIYHSYVFRAILIYVSVLRLIMEKQPCIYVGSQSLFEMFSLSSYLRTDTLFGHITALSLQNFPYFIACLLLPTQLHLRLFLSNFTLCEVNDLDPDTLVLCSCCIPRYGVTIANMYLIIQLGYFTKYCWDNISILNKELM